MEKGCHWGAHRQGQPAVLAHPWQRVNTSPLSPYLRDQPVTTARLLVGPGPPQRRGVGVRLPASAAMVLRAEEHELSAHTGGRATPTGHDSPPHHAGQTRLETTRQAEMGQDGWVSAAGQARPAEIPWRTLPVPPHGKALSTSSRPESPSTWVSGKKAGTGPGGLTDGQHLPPPTTTRDVCTWFT